MKKKSLLKQSILLATLSLSAACFSPALPFVGENHVLVAEAAKPVKLNVAKKTYLIKGKTKTLKLLNTKNKVSWSSSKRAVATINSKGVVKARKTGVTTITATCKGKKYKCTIVVEAPKLSNTKLSLTVGQRRKITLKATKQRVKWVSAKSSIASVNSKGVITAKKPGTVKIAAKIGTRKYYCKVTVKKATSIPETPTTEAPVIKVQSITLNKTFLELASGTSETLVATISPQNASDKTITWQSSDPKIVTVDSTGKITANSVGNATLFAYAGNKMALCTVSVVKPLQSIKLNNDSLNLSVGDTHSLEVICTPSDTTADTTATWISSNPEIASVTNGSISALSEGSTVITAQIGDKKASCTVNVTMTIQQRFNLLKDYIQKNGKINKNNDKFLKKEYTNADVGLIYTGSGLFILTSIYEVPRAWSQEITLTIDPYNLENCKVSFLEINKWDDFGYSMSGTVNLLTYQSSDEIHFNTVDDYGDSPFYSEKNKNANTFLKYDIDNIEVAFLKEIPHCNWNNFGFAYHLDDNE